MIREPSFFMDVWGVGDVAATKKGSISEPTWTRRINLPDLICDLQYVTKFSIFKKKYIYFLKFNVAKTLQLIRYQLIYIKNVTITDTTQYYSRDWARSL